MTVMTRAIFLFYRIVTFWKMLYIGIKCPFQERSVKPQANNPKTFGKRKEDHCIP